MMNVLIDNNEKGENVMLPFIVKYSEKQHPIVNSYKDYTYDDELDVLIWNDGEKKPIIKDDIPLQLSGSHITRAKGDSTSDESTDRN